MKYVSAAFLALAFAGCGDDTTTVKDLSTTNKDMTVVGTDGSTGDMAQATGGFKQPAGTVAVSFSVDDTANKVYAQGDLQWKGSMIYDTTTRMITKDSMWGGPWAPLYDDGPWDQGNPPGHEPKGSVAGDHKWGVTVFVTPPAMGMDTYEYGLNDDYYQSKFGNGWVWQGANGTFVIKAGDTNPVTAAGQTFSAFGTTDLKLVIDKTMADKGAWDWSKVGVKGTFCAWSVQDITASNNPYTFTLSDVVGTGKLFKHSGLLLKGDKPEFIYQLGAGGGKEYKDANGTALTTGITAQTKPMGGAWTPATITINMGNKNTTLTVP